MKDKASKAALASRDAAGVHVISSVATASGAGQSRAAVYESLSRDLRRLIADQTDFLANISNFAALLFTSLPNLNWAGFYLLRGSDLVLGPFQGKPACSCIAMGASVLPELGSPAQPPLGGILATRHEIIPHARRRNHNVEHRRSFPPHASPTHLG